MNTRTVATEYRMSQWAQVIQDRKASGETVKDYCQDRGFSKDAYYYWQKKLREAACEQMAVMRSGFEQTGMIGSGFAEIKIRESQPITQYTGHFHDGQISIEAAGIKITTDAVYPADQLVYLLRELARPC